MQLARGWQKEHAEQQDDEADAAFVRLLLCQSGFRLSDTLTKTAPTHAPDTSILHTALSDVSLKSPSSAVFAMAVCTAHPWVARGVQ